MNPATNQYPRPNLTLLRKRFKQRDERQIINTQVSAKKLGYGHLKASWLWKCGGKPLTRPSINQRAIPTSRSATALASSVGHRKPVTPGQHPAAHSPKE